MSTNMTDNEKWLDLLIWAKNISSFELLIRAFIIPFIPALILFLTL